VFFLNEQVVQAEQKARYLHWKKSEGWHFEYPVKQETYERLHEKARVAWLVKNTSDVPRYPNTTFNSILEFGCSTGHILTACNGFMGVDLAPEIVKANRQRDPQRIWSEGDITQKLPKELDGNFHTVLLPGFLEHLKFEQALGAIRKAKRISTNRVLITVPNGTDLAKNVQDYSNFKHVWICTRPKLKRMMKVCAEHDWRVQFDQDENTIFLRLDKP
jgi:hypothetical protein